MRGNRYYTEFFTDKNRINDYYDILSECHVYVISDIARDCLESSRPLRHKVLSGFLSPAHDKYGKSGLVHSSHRNQMCKLAVKGHPFLRVSTWETEQEGWTRTYLALNSYKAMLEDYVKGNQDQDRPHWIPSKVPKEDLKNVRFYLICGDDLLESFNTPNLWDPKDVRSIGFVTLKICLILIYFDRLKE